MSKGFKLKPLALAMLPVLFAANSSTAFAEEETANKKKEQQKKADEVEVIEVKGIRGSLLRSIASKRLAEGIQDSIHAEDIGKSTDQNIGDALSRVTGVTVQESDGEGTRISVRGAGAHLNTISLNGVALTSSLNGAGGSDSISDESVDLSTLSSDIISSMSVVKTPSADHDEGSLGANVILRTVRPLNVTEDIRRLELQGRYDDYAKKNNYKVGGTFSQKLFDESFGFIVTASKETRDSRRDSLGGSWLSPYRVVDVRAGGATSVQTGQPTTEITKALIADGRSFNTDVNNRERTTATAGFQIVPFDSTDIQLDLSYSKAIYNYDNHRIGTSVPNLEAGQRTNFDGDDQHLWWTIDEESNTLIKSVNRYGSGSMGRRVGGNETENKVATLKINQEITDDLSMEFTAGYSRTDFESLPNATLSTANWARTPLSILEQVPSDEIVPVGYDCTTGDCVLVTGDTPFIYAPQGHPNGTGNNSDSGFNPYDPYAHHLGYIAKHDEISTDINKSAFLDFDYYLDMGGITTVEFGAKASKREKDLITDYQQFQNDQDPVVGENGQILNGIGVSNIYLVDVLAGQGLPVDDFMDGIVAENTNYNTDYLNGWGILDPDKAFEEMFSIPNVSLNRNPVGSRYIAQENVSLYTKLNFEYFDGSVTGNIGVRYVKTENESIGNSAMNFGNNWNVFDPYDLIYNKQLLNQDLAEAGKTCSAPAFDQDNGGQPIYIPDEYPCYEARLEEGISVAYDADGNVTQNVGEFTANWPGDRSWWWNWRHRDQSTWSSNGQNLVDQGIIEKPEDIYRRVFAGQGNTSSEVYLPSLNVNWAISNEFIARFAVSKTMARPRFDSLRPGFTASENLWNPTASRVTTYNPNLQPLESKNFDLSLEWYFNETGLISLAYFRKDMENFEERVEGGVYLKDVRNNYDQTTATFEDMVIQKGTDTEVFNPNHPDNLDDDPETEYKIFVNSVNPAAGSDCLPHRIVQDQIRSALPIACREFNAQLLRNGAGALTEGIEFTYKQTYDFLPGFLRGLGTSFNYTYSDSEYDAEFVEVIGAELKALPTEYTPIHSANTQLFWDLNGHSISLTSRYNTDQLTRRHVGGGAVWMADTHRLDLSATYKFSKNISFSFHALNLTDDVTRTYFTATQIDLGERDADGNVIYWDEGNALDGDAPTSRTISQYKTGRQFRLSTRINF